MPNRENSDKNSPLATPFHRFLMLLMLGILVMMMLGAATRLTESGLSITEWKPLRGILPPLSSAEWTTNFALYRQTQEYQTYAHAMTLDQFKTIFWWEYAHRIAGRALAAALLFGLLVLWWRHALRPRDAIFLLLLFALGALQGGIGWWMVQSGLGENPNIAPYRLALHLSLALLLLLLLCRRLERAYAPIQALSPSWVLLAIRLVLALALCVFVSGAIVAALDAGRIHSDWPLMSGSFLPEDYRLLVPFWQNALYNPSAAQFHHRVLSYGLLAASGVLFLLLRRGARLFSSVRAFGYGLLLLPLGQASLGVAVLQSEVAIPLALAHQLVGVALIANLYLLSRRVVRALSA